MNDMVTEVLVTNQQMAEAIEVLEAASGADQEESVVVFTQDVEQPTEIQG